AGGGGAGPRYRPTGERGRAAAVRNRLAAPSPSEALRRPHDRGGGPPRPTNLPGPAGPDEGGEGVRRPRGGAPRALPGEVRGTRRSRGVPRGPDGPWARDRRASRNREDRARVPMGLRTQGTPPRPLAAPPTRDLRLQCPPRHRHPPRGSRTSRAVRDPPSTPRGTDEPPAARPRTRPGGGVGPPGVRRRSRSEPRGCGPPRGPSSPHRRPTRDAQVTLPL